MSRPNQPESNDWRQQFLQMQILQENQKREIERLERHVDQKLEEVQKNIDDSKRHLKDRMDTYKSGIETKIDALDTGFRGNARIGVFEQMRSMRFHIKIIFACILLIFGLKVFGASWGDWIEGVKQMWEPPQQVQVETPPK